MEKRAAVIAVTLVVLALVLQFAGVALGSTKTHPKLTNYVIVAGLSSLILAILVWGYESRKYHLEQAKSMESSLRAA